MATTTPARLPFGQFLLPALRAKQAKSLAVVDSDGQRVAASVASRPLRPVSHPLRFRV